MSNYRVYLSNGEYIGRHYLDKASLEFLGVKPKGDVVRCTAPVIDGPTPIKRTFTIKYVKRTSGYRIDYFVDGDAMDFDYAGDWRTAWFLAQRWANA